MPRRKAAIEPEAKTLFVDDAAPQAPNPVRDVARPSRAVAVAERKPPKARATDVTLSQSSVLKILADAAADPNVNPEKMRALLDMQKDIRAEEAKQAFTAAFIAMRPHLPTIGATGRIVIEKHGKRIQNTPYATFNEIHRSVTPILSEHGFVLSFAPDALDDGRLVMTATLEHREGHTKHGRMVLPAETSGSKNNVQGVGSAVSYGKRYLMVTMLNLISEAKEDADDDGQQAGSLSAARESVSEMQFLSEKQVDYLRKIIEQCGVSEDAFCKKFEIARIEDLPPTQIGEAQLACQNFAKRLAEKLKRSPPSGGSTDAEGSAD